MQTIPGNWKPGGTGDRDLWYCNRGQPVIFIRFDNGLEYYRMCSSRELYGDWSLRIQEEDLSTYVYAYDEDFLGMSAIDMGLNFFQGQAGASGQKGLVELTTTYDAFPVDEFLNSTVDIFFAPFEAAGENGTFYFNDNAKTVIRIYRGVLANYIRRGNQMTLQITEFSATKHKNIPIRLDEWAKKYSSYFTPNIPDKNRGAFVPICFGTGYFKCIQYDADILPPRIYKFAFNFPDVRSGQASKYYYWNEESKMHVLIPVNVVTTLYTQWGPGGSIAKWYRAELDPIAMPWYTEIPAIFIAPQLKYPQYASNPENLIDGDYTTYDDFNITSLGYFHQYACYEIPKTLFNQRSLMDLYLMLFANFPGYEGYGWDIKYVFKVTTTDWLEEITISGTQFSNMPLFEGGIHYCSITLGYISNLPDINKFSPSLIKEGVNYDDLIENILIQVMAKKNYSNAPPLRLREIALKVYTIFSDRELYVYDNFGNNTIQQAISWLFTKFLDISSDNINYENFLNDYKIDGQVYEEYDSYDLISKLANEFGLIFFEDENGKERIIDIQPADAVFTFTDDDVLMTEEGEVQIEIDHTDQEVASEFFIDYQKNLATGKYEASKFITKDYNNFTYIDTTTLTAFCQSAYDNYHTEKRMTIQCDFVRDDQTAELILGKVIQQYCAKKRVVKITCSWRMLDIECGDQVKLDLTAFSSAMNFYIVGKRYNFDAKTIEFALLETPYTGAGLFKDEVDTVGTSDETGMHIGLATGGGKEDEDIGDYTDYYLEEV